MNQFEVEPEQPISKINSAFLINLRIDAIIKDANRHSRSGQYSKWNDDLDRLWLEIGSDTKEEDDDEKKFVDLTQEYIDCLPDKPIKKGGFERFSSDDLEKLGKQKIALMNKEMFLRRLINKQGKGTAYQDSSEDYMDS